MMHAHSKQVQPQQTFFYAKRRFNLEINCLSHFLQNLTSPSVIWENDDEKKNWKNWNFPDDVTYFIDETTTTTTTLSSVE